MDGRSDKGVTGQHGEFLRVDPAHWDVSKADMIATHPGMLNQAVEALVRIYKGQSDNNPRIQTENAFPAVLMAAAMFEAVMNVVLQEGYKSAPVFRELEKSPPLAKWLAIRGLTTPPSFSSEPGAGVNSLFRLRNAMTHAKTEDGKRLITLKGLAVQGQLRAPAVDRMLASAVDASCDAVDHAPWDKGRLSGSSIWPWSVLLDSHGPLRWHLGHLPSECITRVSLLARAPSERASKASAKPPPTEA